MALITCSQLTKQYGSLTVLDHVDLTIEQGEIVSIVGASGAGKSTLLHIIGTLDNQYQGSAKLDGQEISQMYGKRLAAFRNQNIGFVFQFHQLLPEFTALENVCIPAFIAKKSKKDAEAEAKRLLDFLGLKNRFGHKPSELSGGEQQRVAVARALINKPKVIFADEPSGNLDTKTSEELHHLLLNLRDEMGQTIVVVTHNPNLAQMSDRTLTMADGRIVD